MFPTLAQFCFIILQTQGEVSKLVMYFKKKTLLMKIIIERVELEGW